MKKIIVALLLTVSTITSAYSQNAFYINWDSVAVLKKQLNRLPKTTTPGYALLIGYKDSVLLTETHGVQDLNSKSPVDEQTSFYIASIGKTFTAAAVLQLRQDKKVDLSERLRKYLPELPSFMDNITIFHLLTHTSGLRDFYDVYGEDALHNYTEKNVLQFVMKEDSLKFQPGVSYSYSNTAYVLLAIIVEKISGTPFREYVQNNLLDPAGMTKTVPYLPGIMVKNRATGYKTDSLSNFQLSELPDVYVIGSGGYFSTIADLHKWLVALKTGKVISPASFDLMTSFPITLTGKKSFYGM